MQPRFLTGWLRGLAAFIRGVAAALERISRAPDARLSELAGRFPGAPEHWLQYIASHAPHLMETQPSVPARRSVDMPDVERPSRQVELNLPEVESRVTPLLLKFLPRRAKSSQEEVAFEKKLPAKRPHLQFLSPSQSKSTELRLEAQHERPPLPNAANSNDEHAKKFGKLHLDHPFRSAAKLDLHLTSGQEKPVARTPSARLKSAVELPSGRSQPAWDEKSVFARFLRTMRLSGLEAPLPRVSHHDANLADYRKKPMQIPQFAATVESPRLDPIFEQPLRRSSARNIPAFQNAIAKPYPKSAAENFDAHWPALPPIVETVRDEHIEPPRLSRLIREQEEGLWNA